MPDPSDILQGKRIAFIGRFAGMNRRDAGQLLRDRGAIVLDKPDASTHLVVMAEQGLPLFDLEGDWFDDSCRAALEAGTLTVIRETDLWQRLGLVESADDLQRFHTPAMLAELLGVPVAVIRRWHRRGLIVPAREVRRLPYFDLNEVATARQLAQLLNAGRSPDSIEKELADLARRFPGVERPLSQLSTIVEGKKILLRQGDGLVEPGGQFRFDFDADPMGRSREVLPSAETSPGSESASTVKSAVASSPDDLDLSPDALRLLAAEMEEDGRLTEAVELYRAAMSAGGPDPETCFIVAELLYRLGDSSAARERYYMAIELDEDYVEARANLGCVLAETGQRDLAIAAFEGALRYHGGYADVYYHLARTLDEMGRREEAAVHWQTFLTMAPSSPWAEKARERLGT